jgi:PAS domain S-box-containing protein
MTQKQTYAEMQQSLRDFAEKITTIGSEWQQLQSDIRDETQRLAAVVRDSNDAITLQDLDGNILAWNHGAHLMYGWNEEEALGMNIQQLVPEQCRQEALWLVRQLSAGEEITSFETQRMTKDGRVLDVWLTLTALKNPQHEIYAVASTERDISERKKAEAERERYLQEALQKLKILSGLLPICASCKKIRDDKGYWNQIESYIHNHSEAEFSHSICPECAKKLYPEIEVYPPK